MPDSRDLEYQGPSVAVNEQRASWLDMPLMKTSNTVHLRIFKLFDVLMGEY